MFSRNWNRTHLIRLTIFFGLLFYATSVSGCYTVLWSTEYQMPKVDEYREDFKSKDIYSLYSSASDEYYDYYALPWWASTREYFDDYPYTPGTDYTQPGAAPYTAPTTENNSRHPQQVIAAPSRNNTTTQSKTPPAETKTETQKDNSRDSGGSTQSVRDNDGGRGNSGGGRR